MKTLCGIKIMALVSSFTSAAAISAVTLRRAENHLVVASLE
jgi:hypothetical protein